MASSFSTGAVRTRTVDEEMVEGLVRDVTTLLNFLPNSELPSASPRTVLDGERLNYERWSRVHAGQVAEFEIPYPQNDKQGCRREIGYVIGHQGENPIVRLLPQGKRLVIRSGHIRPIDKTPAIISLIEQGITGAKRQRFNDLLAEINEFYSDSPPEDNHTDVLQAPAPQPEITQPTVRSNDLGDNDSPPEDDHQHPPTEIPATPNAQPSYANHDQGAQIQGRAENPRGPTLEEATGPDEPPSLIRHTENPRRSLRPGAQKPPGFYRRLASGESVADYTACHMRATESERLYGKEMTHNAGITEVTNMIKTRDAADPQDYRKLSPREIREALPSFMFYKAKDETPEPVPLETLSPEEKKQGWEKVVSRKERKREKRRARKIRLRARWVGGGHKQRRSDILAERIAPTARGATHNLLMTIASKEGRQLHVGDIPSAYLQADHKPADGKPVFIIADKHTRSTRTTSCPMEL